MNGKQNARYENKVIPKIFNCNAATFVLPDISIYSSYYLLYLKVMHSFQYCLSESLNSKFRLFLTQSCKFPLFPLHFIKHAQVSLNSQLGAKCNFWRNFKMYATLLVIHNLLLLNHA
jgi:hypothetical protein